MQFWQTLTFLRYDDEAGRIEAQALAEREADHRRLMGGDKYDFRVRQDVVQGRLGLSTMRGYRVESSLRPAAPAAEPERPVMLTRDDLMLIGEALIRATTGEVTYVHATEAEDRAAMLAVLAKIEKA